jgi:23S rRNA (adenine2503-C2)-methyltransferase
MKTDIRDLTLEELTEEIVAAGEPPHRARQIFSWVNQKNSCSFDKMSDLPRSIVPKLKKKYYIGSLVCRERLRAKDGTEKFLWQLEDGSYVESVLIKEKSRKTLCISTQVGCRFKCSFCASGAGGFNRNLRPSEITGQVLSAQSLTKCRVTNIVFMGMGEPLDNYQNLEKAIRIINHPKGIGIGARKITVSTCGIVPGILKLKDIGLQVELSVSLHAASDRLRDELVPVNKRYPLEKLMKACEEYYEDTGRVVTLEYTLIKDKNDLLKDADKLAKIAKRLKAKVNLIGCNPYSDKDSAMPSAGRVKAFKERLRSRGVTTTVRVSKGGDIMAACGQLAARERNGK